MMGHVFLRRADSGRWGGARSVPAVMAAWLAMLLGAALPASAVPFVTPNDVRAGALLLKSDDEGKFVAAPIVGTDVDITVSGPTARTRLTQHFYNPADGWVEGVYLFPMPETAAVDTLRMVVGGRVIVGEIKERQEAKAIYERAKTEGRKASLLEQRRPNMFTNTVANIGPRETVVIQIEYQETVKQADGRFSLRVPLVVAPRFSPGPAISQTVDMGADGWGTPRDAAPEAPVLDPREGPPTNPVTLAVRLQAGFALGDVKSHHHPMLSETVGDDTRVLRFPKAVPADRDFELTWSPLTWSPPTWTPKTAAPNPAMPNPAAPMAGLFREKTARGDYVLAFVTPPPAASTEAPSPRDIVFVIDNSGSMGGVSMEQAKASLLFALGRLRPGDRFNVVRFDDTMEQLFPALVPGDRKHVAAATTFVSRLAASGGTVMVPAMRAALADDEAAADSARPRQVVFLTDGAIGNEAELFETIAARLGRSRVFMVGIGSAPNGHLMSRAAELGRGGYTYIGSAAQVEERMRALFARLERPAVTGLSVAFSQSGADLTPKTLPDLYAGEPLTIAAKLISPTGTMTVSGDIAGRPWSVTLPLAKAADGAGISKYWARARISDAEVAHVLGQISRGEADRRILDLSLEHGLITRVTSLVAVDKTPSRPRGAPLARADVPLNLPAGWDFDAVFGERPNSGEPGAPGTAPRLRDASLVLRDASLAKAIMVSPRPNWAADKVVSQSARNVTLPSTGTDAGALLWRGFILLLASLALIGLVLGRHGFRIG